VVRRADGEPGRACRVLFRPPYVGGRGWVGVRLDGDVDWDEVAELCEEAYRSVAPARLTQQLDANGQRKEDR
jgi:predicted DNA-binding protein (MmcQ/YjbR family)